MGLRLSRAGATIGVSLPRRTNIVAEETLRFHLWKTAAVQPYHWTLNLIQNGNVICTSENYARKADAKHSIDLVHGHASNAKYEDHTGES